MHNKVLIFSAIYFMTILSVPQASAYDNKRTHKDITTEAVKRADIDIYLRTALGFAGGREEKVNGKKIVSWFSEGSFLEDTPACRASNHFHNPMLPWGESFMSDDTTWTAMRIRNHCIREGWPLEYRRSAVTWATGYITPPPNGTVATFNPDPKYAPINWNVARSHFHDAITAVKTSDRENSFAQTFQAVGQVLHLLQDMAVPAHVRNDFQSHLIRPNAFSWYRQPFEHYVESNSGLVAAAGSGGITIPTFAIHTAFFDTKPEAGSNPAASDTLGLAEITNRSYFSDFTIPNNGTAVEHTFPSPQVSSASVQICEDFAPGSTYNRRYISRKNGSACPPPSAERNADHFAMVSLLHEETEITNENIANLTLKFDDNVHNTYAQELLPRAVGYSAGLLNYFFRGSISMIPAGNSADQYVFLNTGTEAMTGAFSIYYDDIDANRILITSAENMVVPGNGQSSPITVPAPISPAPKEKDTYILVFQGAMGNEEGAVVGKVARSWREEWDNDLKGNHTWLYTGLDFIWGLPALYNGPDTVADGRLIKENIQPSGTDLASVNSTIIQDAYVNPAGGAKPYCLSTLFDLLSCFPYDFGTEFPLPITRNTWVRVKVDEMSTTLASRAGGYQAIIITFDNGRSLNFTLPGQEPWSGGAISYLTLGEESAFNIFETFKNSGYEFQEPVAITQIDIEQMIGYPDTRTTVENRQKLVVDYIRLEER